MLKSPESNIQFVTKEKKLVNTYGDILALDPKIHLGVIENRDEYYHVAQGKFDTLLVFSGYIKNNRVICVDNNRNNMERDIGPVKFSDNRQTLCTLAGQYLDIKEQINVLLSKNNPPSLLLEMYIDRIKTCKALGDFAYLNQLLTRK